jgi:hypothetical protein
MKSMFQDTYEYSRRTHIRDHTVHRRGPGVGRNRHSAFPPIQYEKRRCPLFMLYLSNCPNDFDTV